MRYALLRTLFLSMLVALGIGSLAIAQDDGAQQNDAPIAVETVAEGLNSPVVLESPPNDDRRFVVDRVGVIYRLNEDGGLAETPFLDLRDSVVELQDGFDERGLLGLAFHPHLASRSTRTSWRTAASSSTTARRFVKRRPPTGITPR